MVLIDTHALIWALYDSGKLSETAKQAIRQSDCCVSIVSLWEMSIKMSKGSLKLRETITEVADRCVTMGVELLALRPEHFQKLMELPDYHRDPFDRIIMAQSLAEGFPLVTKDENIWAGYPAVGKIW